MSYVLKWNREDDLKRGLQSVAEKVTQMVADVQCSHGELLQSEEAQDILRGQIGELWRDSHPIRMITGDTTHIF